MLQEWGETKRQRGRKGGMKAFLQTRDESCSSRGCVSQAEGKRTDITDVVMS